MSTYARDHETTRTVGGVRTATGHWSAKTVHAFHRWTGDTTLETHCGLTVDLAEGGAQTTDMISCLQCGQASWGAFRGNR